MSISAERASARKDFAEQYASSQRDPTALSTAQCTSSRMPFSIHPRIVAPAPISMSSECAPMQSTDSVSPGRAIPTCFIEFASCLFGRQAGSLGKPPWHRASLDQILQTLLVLERVHRPPEAFMPDGHELVGLDQPTERRLDQLVAIGHVVEDLLSEDEESAIDPEVGVLAAAQPADLPASVDVHQMQAERRPDRQEASDLAARPEYLRHLLQVGVGETVAIVGVEHFLAGHVLAHGPEALPDVAPDAGVDHRDAPVLLRITEDLHFLAEAGNDAVGVGLRLVVQEEILDDVGLVTKAQHEILVTVLAVVVHEVPQDRLVADRDHRLGQALGNISDSRAQTSAKKNRLHRLCLSLPVAAPPVAVPTPTRVRPSMSGKGIRSENHAALPLLVCSIARMVTACKSSFGLTLLAATALSACSLANIDVG